MAGVLEQLIRPQKRAVVHCISRMNPKALELQMAKEILAEVFCIGISEVEEMLCQRSEVQVPSRSQEDALWPESFCLG